MTDGPRRRIAFVVQRYGEEIAGGAEYHCRLIAELLARRNDVTVFTTCALDYISWANHYPPEETTLGPARVVRFPTTRTRTLEEFARLSRIVEKPAHTDEDEEQWMDEQGPFAPALVDRVRRDAAGGAFDAWIFFSYRYWTTCRALPCAVPAILAPTAEDDGTYALRIFRKVFQAPAAFAFNSVEEREMLERAAGRALPGVVVGVGSALPARASGEAFRKRFGIEGPFLLYVGRIDNNKGCDELFDFYLRYRAETGSTLGLVLMGKSILPVPDHPGIRALGFQPDDVKWDALDASLALAMPSRYESLSMVTLEAFWARRPVLANARCAVLRGQCRRSGGGLYYASYEEFREALALLEARGDLRRRLGDGGRRYFEANYAWPEIERKYDILLRMALSAGVAA